MGSAGKVVLLTVLQAFAGPGCHWLPGRAPQSGLLFRSVSARADRTNFRAASRMMLAARLHDGYFQVPQDGSWKAIYIRGVDIGPATPGHFATEPPVDPAVYADWLDKIGAMGANAVRVYTLLPPGFYRALLD